MIILKSLGIRTVTLITSACIAGAALLAAGYGLYAVHQLEDRITYETDNLVPSISALAKIDGSVSDSRLLVAKHLLAVDPAELQRQATELQSTMRAVDEDIAAYRSMLSDETERGMFGDVVNNWTKWKATAEQIVRLPADQREGRGRSQFNTELSPIGRALDDSLGKEMEYNAKLAEDGHEAAQKVVSTAFTVMVAICGAAVAVFLLSLAIQRNRLGAPLAQITGAMEEMAGGNLDRAIPCSELHDELGQIARALGAIKDEVQARSRAEVEERDAVRARVVGALAEGMDKLKNGRLDCQIKVPFPPELDILRTDFNATVTSLAEVIVDVSSAADSVTIGSSEIASAASDLSSRTISQAAAIEETSASVRQISNNVGETAKVAEDASRNAREAETSAALSGEVMVEAVGAMDEISKSSAQMEAIVTLIDGIAFQTNLLALNAGVEAARAGEAGKGFAVVASEVRSLAQRAGEAAREISGIIKVSGANVTRGVGLITRTQEALHHIHARTSAVAGLIRTIAEAANEQAAALGQIDAAVGEMDGMTQKNAALVEESTAASRNLADEARRLEGLMSRFETGSGSASRSRLQPAPAAPRRVAPLPPVSAQPQRTFHGNAAVAEDWSSF